MGELKDLLTHATSRPARQYIANIKELHRLIRQAEVRGKPAAYLERLRFEGREAIQKTLRADQEAELARLEGDLGRERKRFEAGVEKNLERIDIRSRMAERRYRAMSDGELQALVATPPADQWQFDVMAGELRARGLMTDHKSLLDGGAEAGVREPWRHGEVGAAILREMELASPVSGTGIRLDYSGKTAAVDYEEVYEAVAAEEAADE